jgi:hypothetical protein
MYQGSLVGSIGKISFTPLINLYDNLVGFTKSLDFSPGEENN